jgi:hypothetical protein
MVRVLRRKSQTAHRDLKRAVVVLIRLEIVQVIKELVQAVGAIRFTLQPQGTLQTNPNQELQVVCQARNE